MQLTLDFNQAEKATFWKGLISKMTTEEIQRRSLLVSMSEKQSLGDSDENTLFQKLLTQEYHCRMAMKLFSK